MTLETAIKFSEAWEIAYKIRANRGLKLPPDVHRKMMKAGKRMDEAGRKEQEIRQKDRQKGILFAPGCP